MSVWSWLTVTELTVTSKNWDGQWMQEKENE